MALNEAVSLDPDLFDPAVTAGTVAPTAGTAPAAGQLLDPGFHLTLRPMRYPQFYEMYRAAIRNTWTVEEIDFSDDLVDLQRKLLPAERHLINRLVAFFATGDSIGGTAPEMLVQGVPPGLPGRPPPDGPARHWPAAARSTRGR